MWRASFLDIRILKFYASFLISIFFFEEIRLGKFDLLSIKNIQDAVKLEEETQERFGD
jgi:hypothetical protein